MLRAHNSISRNAQNLQNIHDCFLLMKLYTWDKYYCWETMFEVVIEKKVCYQTVCTIWIALRNVSLAPENAYQDIYWIIRSGWLSCAFVFFLFGFLFNYFSTMNIYSFCSKKNKHHKLMTKRNERKSQAVRPDGLVTWISSGLHFFGKCTGRVTMMVQSSFNWVLAFR